MIPPLLVVTYRVCCSHDTRTRLHPFLLSELERATNCTPEAGTGSSGEKEWQRAAAPAAAARAEMHPVLYPILLLLARLKAGGETSGVGIGQAEVRTCGANGVCCVSRGE